MLDEYASAFARYLRTGTVGALSGFCAEDADVARLRVYRNGFLKACIDALRANYTSVEHVTGEERFAALARPFVEANPPGTASLVEYGEDFPRHVRDTRDVHGLDWLASFAALDRAWTEVCFAEDDDIEAAPHLGDSGVLPGSGGWSAANAQPVPRLGRPNASAPADDGLDDARAPSDSNGLSAAAERSVSDSAGSATPASAGGVSNDAETLMTLRGRLSPRVRLVSLDYRVLDAWSRLREGEPGPRVEIRHAPQQVLVWRSGAETLYRDLAVPEHAFIAGVAAGRTCGEAAGAALDVDSEFDLVTAFASLLHHRMLTFEHRGPAKGVVRRCRVFVESTHDRRPGAEHVWRVSES